VAESRRIGAAIGGLTDRGFGVLYVTHRLDEALQVCDRISVLRDGSLVGTVEAGEISEEGLAGLMFGGPGAPGPERGLPSSEGRAVPDEATRSEAAGDRRSGVLVQVRGLSLASGDVLDLDVGPGEIMGITGAAASDHCDVVQRIYGLHHRVSGDVWISDRAIRNRTPSRMRRSGVGFVSGDRARRGGVAVASVAENLTTVLEQDRAGILRPLHLREERRQSAEIMEYLGVTAPRVDVPFSTLSGGNQQKVLVGRWLFSSVKVLLLDEPTVGVDLRSVHRIIGLIRDFAAQERGALVTSTEYEDLPALCTRVLVFCPDGSRQWLEGSKVTRDAIISLAYGGRAGPALDRAGAATGLGAAASTGITRQGGAT